MQTNLSSRMEFDIDENEARLLDEIQSLEIQLADRKKELADLQAFKAKARLDKANRTYARWKELGNKIIAHAKTEQYCSRAQLDEYSSNWEMIITRCEETRIEYEVLWEVTGVRDRNYFTLSYDIRNHSKVIKNRIQELIRLYNPNQWC